MRKLLAIRSGELCVLASLLTLLGCSTSDGARAGDSAGAVAGDSSAGTAGGAGTSDAGGSSSDAGGATGAGGSGTSGTSGDAGTDSGPTIVNGCTIPALPSFAKLTTNYKLPDPFMSLDKTRITQQSQWACRREEIAAELQEYELGPLPAKSGTVTGAMNAGSITVTVQDGANSISFDATITLPTGGSAPYPALVTIGASPLVGKVPMPGVAVITFNNDDMAVQTPTSRGMGKFYTMFGADHPAGAMIAWTWGVSRLIDALQTTPDAQIDTTHLAVTGCSRNGKGALVVGAFEDRIALVIPEESGTGGVGSWRVADMQAIKMTVQTAAEIVSEAPWFRSSFGMFNASVARLPYDHHMLMAMVAPRALLAIENTSMEWLGNVSTYTDSVEAHTVWEALGIPDKMGFSQIGGHMHCDFPASQQPEVSAYVQRFLLGDDTQNTTIMETDGGYTVDMATWVDWTTPTLQ
ncbi:MAG TPA: hypothetical protein VGM29_12615 [Polyangiaceae bacterium]